MLPALLKWYNAVDQSGVSKKLIVYYRHRKMYEEEKHLRTLQLEAIRFLWKEVQSLQNWKSEVLTSQNFKTMDSSRTEDSSYNYSQEIQNTLQRMETAESGKSTINPQGLSSGDQEKQKELEKTCAKLQNQVTILYVLYNSNNTLKLL